MKKSVLTRLANRIRTLGLLPAQWRLEHSGRAQHKRFDRLTLRFSEIYQQIKTQEHTDTTELWRDFGAELERSLLPAPRWDFLHNPTIRATMVMAKGGQNLKAELAFLRSFFPPHELERVVREDAVGRPYLVDANLLTSHNTVHHAHHIARFISATHADIQHIRTVVEWGGGYGNLAKLWRRMAASPPTWIIIDLPILAALQWLYLATTIGEESVRLITTPDTPPLIGGITIVPLQFLDTLNVKTDLFVSTWAISESPVALQDEVVTRNWFGARHLLLGYQESNEQLPDAGRIGTIAQQAGAILEDIPTLPRQHYAFR